MLSRYHRIVVALAALLCVSSAGAAPSEGGGALSPSPSLAEAYCHAATLMMAYNERLMREQGIGYEDSLQPRDEVVATKPMVALSTLPGQGDAARIAVPAGARVVVAERVPFENPEFYRVALPQQGLKSVFMATAEFSQFATIENQIKHRDRVAALRMTFFDRVERELLTPLGVSYEMLYRLYNQPGQPSPC